MCDTEVYTVRLDTVNTTVSNVNFTSYINIPLRNVIKAEVLAASIHGNAQTSNVFYVHVEELVSKFNDRADLEYTIGVSGSSTTQGSLSAAIANISKLRTSIVCIPAERSTHTRTMYETQSNFPSDVAFIEPIRQIKTLSVSIYDEQGALITDTGPTFLTFRFTCSKPNVCLYPDRGGVLLL
jgi:hypothetical protein